MYCRFRSLMNKQEVTKTRNTVLKINEGDTLRGTNSQKGKPWCSLWHRIAIFWMITPYGCRRVRPSQTLQSKVLFKGMSWGKDWVQVCALPLLNLRLTKGYDGHVSPNLCPCIMYMYRSKRMGGGGEGQRWTQLTTNARR